MCGKLISPFKFFLFAIDLKLDQCVLYLSKHFIRVIYGKNYTPVMHLSNSCTVYNKSAMERL